MDSSQFLKLLLIIPIINSLYHVQTYDSHQPCTAFNLLCSCTTVGLSLGSLTCKGIPMTRSLSKINNTKIFELRLHDNQLEDLGNNNFHGTGLWKIEIRNNFLMDLSYQAFSGVEHSLGELILANNKLQKIPRKAIQSLLRIQLLDISGNYITTIFRADFQTMKHTLRVLNVANNALSDLSQDTFWDLISLESLDLCGNNLITLPEKVFRSGQISLSEVNLCNNLFHAVPLSAVKNLKNLHTFNLNYNHISTPVSSSLEDTMNIDTLLLEGNEIYNLSSMAFENYRFINKLSLKENPLQVIENYAFQNVIIKELNLKSCRLSYISEKAFVGLENTLEGLQLDFNNLLTFPFNIFINFTHLKNISFQGNDKLTVSENFIFPNSSIEHLNLLGIQLSDKNFNTIKTARNIQSCSLTLKQNILPLFNFSSSVEEINIHSGLRIINSQTFKYIPRLKKLNLSGNKIEFVDEEAFTEIGDSLENLNLAHALSNSYLPVKPFNHLVEMRILDLSYNFIESIPVETFHCMQNLQHLYLHDNNIKNLQLGTFSQKSSANLQTISLSFNSLSSIPSMLFKSLQNLKNLYLDHNFIKEIDHYTFVDLKSLIYLTLEANEISHLNENAFQNLPQLNFLNLAYNKIYVFNFEAFDQVGSLGNLKVDLSFNLMEELDTNSTVSDNILNVRTMQLANNKISELKISYFHLIQNSATHLYLQNNGLNSLYDIIFESMPYLQFLDISNNNISRIGESTFTNLIGLQILNLAHNQIENLPMAMLTEQHNLHHLDISHNKIIDNDLQISSHFIPIEILNLSYNKLTKIPLKLFNNNKTHLSLLDLSYNQISYINNNISNIFPYLCTLNISNNLISSISAETIGNLKHLISLDVSHNPLKQSSELLSGIPHQIKNLNIANICLINIPALNLPELFFLNLSLNFISHISAELFANNSNIHILDLSNNHLKHLPSDVWISLPLLIKLSLANNPFHTFNNDTFFGMGFLQELDLRNEISQKFESGMLGHLKALRQLYINSNYESDKFNIGSIIQHNLGLKKLFIHMTENSLTTQLHGRLPHLLGYISIKGKQLTNISPEAFTFVQTNVLTLIIQETSVSSLTREIFKNMKNIKYLLLDVQNNLLQSLEMPITNENTDIYSPELTIKELKLAGNLWICDCSSIGWIENWMRRQRKQKCFSELQEEDNFSCINMNQAIRSAECFNRGNNSLIDIFKTDIECITSACQKSFLGSNTILFVFLSSFLRSVILNI